MGAGNEDPLHMTQSKFMRFPSVRLNRDLLFQQDGPPPLSKLLGRRGEAVATFHVLNLVREAVANPHAPIASWSTVSQSVTDGRLSWPGLLGYPRTITQRAADLRFHRALDALSEARLVELPPLGTKNRYRKFSVMESGAARTPSDAIEQQMSVHLPVDYFAQGWNLVLTAAETAVLLMVMDLRNAFSRRQRFVFVPRERRLTRYGLSDEVYASHRELHEFRLLFLWDPVEHRRRGRARPVPESLLLPLEFTLHRPQLEWDAYGTVTDSLARRPVAPHLTSMYQLRRKFPTGTITVPRNARDEFGLSTLDGVFE
jgi:hypothetical protein